MSPRKPGESVPNKVVSDAELVRAAQRGDKRAFVEIVTRYQAVVCGIALGILNDFAASEDVGQEAFLTAWRKIHDLREPERLRAWLAQIARNAALGHLRARKPHDSLAEDFDLADAAPTPDEAAATEEEAALVRQSLAELPETYRTPLILFYREGQSVRAVAETLAISEDAVKQRLARGRDLCRDKMSSLVERVLTKTRPSAIFTASIAVAIGALAAPSVVAGAAFASGAAAGVTATTSSIKAILTASMSISKGFMVATALVAVVCIPIGYSINSGTEKTSAAAGGQAVDASAAKLVGKPLYEDSALFAEWRALHDKYGTNAAAMPMLFKAIGGLTDAFHRQALTVALISEWAQVDPKGGLAFFMGKGHDDSQRQDFFKTWLAQDPQAAVSALLASGPGWDDLARTCLIDIAKVAPNRVAEIASRLPKSDNYWDTSVRDAFAIVAGQGLAQARSAAESLAGPYREQALSGVARAWAKTDFNAAIAWAKMLPDGTDRNEIIRAALMGRAAVDPAAALDAVGIVPEGGRHAYFATTTGARVLTEAANADFDSTVAWLANHPGNLNREDLYGIAHAVSDHLNADPAGFLSQHAADGSLKVLTPAVESALLNNSSSQVGAVWDWLKTQPASDQTQPLLKEVLQCAAWQNPALAMQIATELPNTADGKQQLENLARDLFNGGRRLDRFDEFLSEAPAQLKTPLVEKAFDLLPNNGVSDPQDWVSRLQLLPDSDRTHGTESLARAWASQNPGDAIAWADTLPGNTQNAADAAIVTGWARNDAQGAADWVASMPPGPQRDQSAEALVNAVVDQHPRDAWDWAVSIGDPTEREQAATRVVQTMATRDPAAAREWIDTAPLSADTKQKLQNALQHPGSPR